MSGAAMLDAGTGESSCDHVAIIGMACRFPGSDNLAEFWANLCDGRDCIKLGATAGANLANSGAARGLINDIAGFDAAFFGIPAGEAEYLNPQIRLFMETIWSAIENAGYDVTTYDGVVSLYAAAGANSYEALLKRRSPAEKLHSYISNAADFLPTQISYRLNLRGESVAVQTACSASLVAVHLACRSLLVGESDIALAGSASLGVSAEDGYEYQEGMIYSPEGRCRAFDRRAQGMVPGDGVGVVVLKRLDEALRDGDHVYCVIRGSALNNDGRRKISFPAPSVAGQAEVVATAIRVAGVSADTIGYVEAHGTGTLLGDPIEIEALTRAFRLSTERSQFCALSTVKSNIGHTIHTAGVAGLIKAALAVWHGMMPASLHFEQPNPEIDFENSPFFVNTVLRTWPAAMVPRRAGVSSFGVGGTNVHAIVEEAPRPTVAVSRDNGHLLVLSAKTRSALDRMAKNLHYHLQENPDLDPADLAYTLQIGRAAFAHRAAMVVQNLAAARDALASGKGLVTAVAGQSDRAVTFVFTDLGTPYLGIGRELYDRLPAFRDGFDHCARRLRDLLDVDPVQVLYPGAYVDTVWNQTKQRYDVTHAMVFAIQHALARLWESLGVKPQAVIGCGGGELAAACEAGILSLDDALSTVVTRARLMQAAPSGAMLAVNLGEADGRLWQRAGVSIAQINGADYCVLSGPRPEIDAVARELSDQSIFCQRLNTSCAAQSAMMEPVVEPLTRALQEIPLAPPRIPMISCATGDWLDDRDAADPTFWAAQTCRTVRFTNGLDRLFAAGHDVFVELGPGTDLTAVVNLQSNSKDRQPGVASLRNERDPHSDWMFFLTAVGELFLASVAIDWPQLHAGETRRRLPLPSYPFERQAFWPNSRRTKTAAAPHPAEIAKLPDTDDWLYVPTWKKSRPPIAFSSDDAGALGGHWLLFVADNAFCRAIVDRLRGCAAARLTCVHRGDGFRILGDGTCAIDPMRASDYCSVVEHAAASLGAPDRILHLWNYHPEPAHGAVGLRSMALEGFHSMLFLVQAMNVIEREMGLWVVTTGAQAIEDDQPDPEKAALLGLCTTISQERANVQCRAVDFGACGAQDAEEQRRHADTLLSEINDPRDDSEIAYRGGYRRVLEPEHCRVPASPRITFRNNGVYLIAGGFGHVGAAIAEYLARAHRATLILVTRGILPSTEEPGANSDTGLSARVIAVRRLEALGARVLVRSVDTADREAMTHLVSEIVERFGTLHGVVHAAGVVDPDHLRFINETTAGLAAEIFWPHVRGSLVLQDVLADADLDFCVLCSSLSSFVGGLTYGTHAAGHRFMDAVALCRSRIAGASPWVTLNYDTWYVPSRRAAIGSGAAHLNILVEEGVEVLVKALSLGQPQILASTVPLTERLAAIKRSFDRRRDTAPTSFPSPDDGTPQSLSGSRDKIEEFVLGVFRDALGDTDVTASDNFFDRGGASLMMLDIVRRINDRLSIHVPVEEAFGALTAAEMTDLCCRVLREA